MARPVRVDPEPRGEAHEHRIKPLDQADRIAGRMVGGDHRKRLAAGLALQYRWNVGNDSAFYETQQAKLQKTQTVDVPTLFIAGSLDDHNLRLNTRNFVQRLRDASRLPQSERAAPAADS